MLNNNRCSIFIWNEKVGELIIVNDSLYFKYDEDFNMEISPLELRNSRAQYNFSDLKYQHGLPGVFADSLPDSFGMKIIDDYFNDNFPRFEANVIDKLLFIGSVSFGALSYRPAYKITEDGNIPIKLAEIKEHKKNILEKNNYTSLREAVDMYRSFSPAGGARQKIILNYNKKDNSFSIGKNINNDIPILLKINESEFSGDSRNSIIEYIYSKVAQKAGIRIPETYLFKDEEHFFHFAIERFDINANGDKLHKHTLSGLLNFDKIKRIDYSDFMNIAQRQLFLPKEDIKEIYRRMVFNYIYNNNDDHLKNHSFLMSMDAKWRLSPAYDLTYNDKITSRNMMMSINNKKSSDVTIDDFKKVALDFNIEDYRDIIEEVQGTKEYYQTLVKEMIPKSFDYDIELYLRTKHILPDLIDIKTAKDEIALVLNADKQEQKNKVGAELK